VPTRHPWPADHRNPWPTPDGGQEESVHGVKPPEMALGAFRQSGQGNGDQHLHRGDWHELARALADCKRSKAVLVIAKRLNEEGHTTRRGKEWNAMQAKRVVCYVRL